MLEKFVNQTHTPIIESLHASAQKHANASNGLLICLPIDLEKFPHQSLNDSVVKGSPAELPKTVEVASLIRPKFPEIVDYIKKTEEKEEEKARSSEIIGNVLDSQHNVIVGFDHAEDVVTFIMNSLAVANRQRERNTKFKSAIIASKMLDFLAVDIDSFGDYSEYITNLMNDIDAPINNGLVYARDILARGFDRQFLTYPNTQSTRTIRESVGSAIQAVNGTPVSAIKKDFNPGGLRKSHTPTLLFGATSGTINKSLDVNEYEMTKRRGIYDVVKGPNYSDSDEVIEVIGHIAPGLISFARKALTFAGVAKMNTNNPFIEIDKYPIALINEDRIRELGRRQVELLDIIDPRVTHIYDGIGNLPLLEFTE